MTPDVPAVSASTRIPHREDSSDQEEYPSSTNNQREATGKPNSGPSPAKDAGVSIATRSDDSGATAHGEPKPAVTLAEAGLRTPETSSRSRHSRISTEVPDPTGRAILDDHRTLGTTAHGEPKPVATLAKAGLRTPKDNSRSTPPGTSSDATTMEVPDVTLAPLTMQIRRGKADRRP